MASFQQQGNIGAVHGRLDQAAVINLWHNRQGLLTSETTLLNLADVEYCDSAGVAFLFELVNIFAKNERSLQLVSASEQLKKLIILYDLKDFFTEEAQ
ncbi:STAS domain-containing protein [Shewanella sp.]|nr:STAS domain-containing protein [Shewanella sp.]